MNKKGKKILAAVLALCLAVPAAAPVQRAEAASQTSDFGLETAYNIAAEGTVLLKNDNHTLPLAKNSKINVFGITQVQTFLGGSGSGSGSIQNPVYLTEALKAEGFQVNDELYKAYNAYWNAEENWEEIQSAWGTSKKSLLRRCIDVVDGVGLGQAFSEYVIGYREMDLTEDMLKQAKDYSDTAIVLISRSGSEGADLAESDMCLFDDEKKMVDQVAKTFSKVVVLFNTCTNLEMGFLEEYPNIKAAAMMWAPGIRGCEAVADILSGDVNPSGKLADSAAYHITDYPSNENFGVYYEADDTTRYLEYEEDIYVGYRYFDTFHKEVQYPFGYGLSYTDFEMTAVGCKADANQVTVQVKVKNVGDSAGKQVVEVYYGAPDGTLEKPAKELAAFAKTEILQPQESQIVTITYKTRDMSSYSEEKEAYLLEAGDYQIYVGDSSADVKNIGNYRVNTTVTYKTDSATGNAIENHFENERADSLTTLSKKDPQHTYPTEPEDGILAQEVSSTEADTEKEVVPAAENAQSAVPAAKRGADDSITLKDVYFDETKWDAFLSQFTDDELILYLMNGEFKTLTYDKFGIPRMDMKDGPANIQAGTGGWGGDIGTSFPVAVMLACTWNEQLARDYGTAAGIEAKAFVKADGSNAGTEVWYAPALNIHRNPRCGRNFEYYSEDPVLAGTIAAGATVGAQSQGLQVALKHFAVNNQETGRVGVNTYVSERALREIYLKAFEIPVKAGATGVMSAFNSIGTTWCAANKALLVDVLRNEWGFDGFVITDAYMDVTAEKWPDTAALVYAQNNLFLSSQTSTTEGRYLTEYNNIKAELEKNPEFRSQLETNVKQVLKVLMKTYAFSDVLGSDENTAFTQKASLFETVKSVPAKDKPSVVSAIALNASRKTLKIGQKFTLKATVLPADAANKEVIYSTGNSKTATVSSEGVIKARAAGKAVITVSAKDGSGVKASVTIYVKPAKVKGVSVKKTGKNKIRLAWKSVKNASGYIIYRANGKNKKYKKVAVVKGGKKTNYSKLKYKKNTYYKVKAYKTIDGKKVSGAASSAKKIK